MQHKYDENLDDRDCMFSWVALLEIKNYYSGDGRKLSIFA